MRVICTYRSLRSTLSTAFRVNATVMGSKNTNDGEANEKSETKVENGENADDAVEEVTEE